MQNRFVFGRTVLLMAVTALSISACGQDNGKGKAQPASLQCGSPDASNALKRHVMNAASQTSDSSAPVRALGGYLQAVSMSAEEQDKPAFDRALQSVTALGNGASQSSNGATIRLDEVTDLGLSKDGSVRCWASLMVTLPPAAQKSLDDLKQVLWAEYNIDASPLSGSVSLKVFYALANARRLTVSESDLSEVDAARISDLIRLGEGATLALAPINAAKKRQDGYVKELDQAKSAVLGVSLEEARLALRQHDTQVGEIWRGFDEETRKVSWLNNASGCAVAVRFVILGPSQKQLIPWNGS
jgi:hypothetical protein